VRPLILALAVLSMACAPRRAPPRDPLPVEVQRARISKVRHAIDETRRTLADAPEDAPWRAELTLRLAELLSEEARYHWLVAQEREGGAQERLHVPQVRLLKEQAISTARQLLVSFPDAAVADRARFLVAEELRDLGEDDAMRDALEGLVREHPDSPLVPEARLRLGRYHFENNDLALAGRAYKAVIADDDTSLHPLAHYRLAWVQVNEGDCKVALGSFEKAMEQAGERPPAPPAVSRQARGFALPDLAPEVAARRVDVAREALVDSVWCATQVKKPDEVMAWLRDQARDREAYVAALAKLGRRFAILEEPGGAAEVARRLLELGPDEEDRLEDARLLHHSVGRTRDYTRVDRDVTYILEAFGRARVGPRVDAERAGRLAEESESLARDLALRADRQRRGQGEPSLLTEATASPAQVARAYTAWLRAFPEGGQHVEMRLNAADSHADAGQWVQAGHRYRDAAEALAVRGEEGDDTARIQALLDAVVAYEEALDQGGRRVDRVAARAGLREAGASFLADKGGTPAERRRVAFAIARSHYDDGDHEKSRDLLMAVALGWPGTDEGDAAARLALDAARAEDDIPGLLALGRRLQAPGSGVSPEVKAELGPLMAAAEQRQLDTLALSAAGEEGSLESLLEFVDRYEGTDLGERALLGAFVAARAAGEQQKLEELGEEVLRRFPDSAQAPGVASSLGRAAAARYDLDEAVTWLERAAAIQEGSDAVASWVAAAGIRTDLGDTKGAAAALEQALDVDSSDPGAQLALGELLVRGAIPLSRIERRAEDGTPALQARVGYALLRAGDPDAGEMWFRRALSAPQASSEALAVAHYGLAERLHGDLSLVRPSPDLALMDEVVATVDLSMQAYLEAARQPDPAFSQAALARLARVAQVGAETLGNWPLPAELSADDQTMLREALQGRAAELTAARDEALAECASRARQAWRYDPAGVACAKGVPPADDPIAPPGLRPRSPAQVDPALREAVASQPKNGEALLALGQGLLAAGDPHQAVLVLEAAASAGAGTDALLDLGRAHEARGDRVGAVQAWGRALEADDTRARAEIDRVLGAVGLSEVLARMDGDAPEEAP
jgi:cellulose synthase operon protein C